MKTKIGWTFITDTSSAVFFEPIEASKSRRVIEKNGVGVCPAVRSFEQRTFLVKSPYTFRIRAIRDEGLSFRPVYPDTHVSEEVLRSILEFQPKHTWRDVNNPILQLSLPYVFFADENVFINQIEPINYEYQKNWELIQGRFNIHEWQRPLNWSIEWKDTSVDLFIKRGQPLFNVLFEVSDPRRALNLIYIPRNKDIEKALDSSRNVSNLIRGTFSLFKRSLALRSKKLIK